MKKIIYMLTAAVLFIQLSTLSTFAATPIGDKTLFTNVSEVFGAYTYDNGNFNRDVLVFSDTNASQFFRSMNSTNLIKDNGVLNSAPKYTLSKDKKSVTATYLMNLPGLDIKMNCITVFMKDKSGKVFFNDHYEEGKTYANYKSYPSLEACKKAIKSSTFLPILEAEKNILDQIVQYNTDLDTLRGNYKDTETLSETNLLEGYYLSEAEDLALEFEFMYDYSDVTYEDFQKMVVVTLHTLDGSYSVNTPYYMVENGLASYMKNDDYYVEVTAIDRLHISKVKFVYNGKVFFEKEIPLTYSEE